MDGGASGSALPGFGHWETRGTTNGYTRVSRTQAQSGASDQEADAQTHGRAPAGTDKAEPYLAMDFMGDSLNSGRSYRVLNILDEGNREALAIEADFSLPSTQVVELLDDLVTRHGVPRQLRCDNGPEFIA
jgi:transposase InsO family protein